MAELVLAFADGIALDRHWREHLSRGGAWVAGATLARDTACTLILVRSHDGARLPLPARVVFADGNGCGLALDDFGPPLRARLEAFALTVEPAVEAEADDGGDDAPGPAREPLARNVFERLRGLTMVEQHRVARDGETPERVALERLYGKEVWASLLANPRLTPPEVARIARMANLPRPLLDLIASNAGWVRSPEVRRALLSNPRLAADHVPRILRLLPKHELKLVPSQTAYPVPVRDTARRMLVGKDA